MVLAIMSFIIYSKVQYKSLCYVRSKSILKCLHDYNVFFKQLLQHLHKYDILHSFSSILCALVKRKDNPVGKTHPLIHVHVVVELI